MRMELNLVQLADEGLARVVALIAMAFEGVVLLDIIGRFLDLQGVKGTMHVQLPDRDSSLCS